MAKRRQSFSDTQFSCSSPTATACHFLLRSGAVTTGNDQAVVRGTVLLACTLGHHWGEGATWEEKSSTSTEKIASGRGALASSAGHWGAATRVPWWCPQGRWVPRRPQDPVRVAEGHVQVQKQKSAFMSLQSRISNLRVTPIPGLQPQSLGTDPPGWQDRSGSRCMAWNRLQIQPDTCWGHVIPP